MAADPSPEFVGNPGPGAQLDVNVPLPGLFTGKRMVLLEGISTAQWHADAYTFGTPPAEALGLSKQGSGYTLENPARYTDVYLGRKDAVSSVPLSEYSLSSDMVATISKDMKGNPVARPAEPRKKTTARTTEPPAPEPVSTPVAASSVAAAEWASTLNRVNEGIVSIPASTWSGELTTVDVDVTAKPQPALFIIQSVGISSFLGTYGMGKTVKTFSLLPGEETKIHTRTWKSTSESRQAGSSIIDSYNSTTADEFATSLYSESTDSQTKERASQYGTDVSAGLSIGIAKVGGGASAELEFASSSEQFFKTTSEAVSKHAATASSNRETSVTSSSESSVATEDEEVIERTIRNINVKRVLNFVFRELNQEYLVKTHLKDVRIGFSNGNIDSWMEAPLSGLRGLLSRVLANEAAITEVGQSILRMIGMAWDVTDTPVGVLERVALSADGRSVVVTAATRDAKGNFPVPPADGSWTYRFRRGPLAQQGNPIVVDGVLLREDTVVLKTDSLVIEALLGTADALDDYSVKLQEETIREKTLINDARAAETAKLRLGIDLVQRKDTPAVGLYAAAFNAPPPSNE